MFDELLFLASELREVYDEEYWNSPPDSPIVRAIKGLVVISACSAIFAALMDEIFGRTKAPLVIKGLFIFFLTTGLLFSFKDSFYELIRLVSSFAFIALVMFDYKGLQEGKPLLLATPFIWAFSAVLTQQCFPFPFNKTTWLVLDVVWITLLAVTLAYEWYANINKQTSTYDKNENITY